MKTILISGLAAGALTVLLCSSQIGGYFRRLSEKIHPVAGQLANCCFCTSWWVSIAMLQKFSLVEWAATVAVANFTVLLIHLGIATIGEDDELDKELARATELQSSLEDSSRREL